jgi:signal transduction histidine kinase
MAEPSVTRHPLLIAAVSAALVVAILLTLHDVVIRNVEQTRILRQETDRVLHTLEVQRTLDAVLIYASEGDSAARGYLLSSDERLLAQYRNAHDQLTRVLGRLPALLADNPAQLARLRRLTEAVQARFDRLNSTLAAIPNGTATALAVARITEAGVARAEIRILAHAMEQHEAALLAGRRAQVDRAYGQAVRGRIASGIVSAALLVFIIILAAAYAYSSKRRELALMASEGRAREAMLHEQEARHDAEEANRLKDEFLAVLSHELRTPLNAVMGWTQILQTAKIADATIIKALNAIQRNACAQQRLVEDLLDVSRIVTGKFKIDRNPVDLQATVCAAVETLRATADAKRITLETDVQPSTMTGDQPRLRQVVTNLLENAIKFTPDAGTVWVTLTTDDGRCTVVVRDTGAGIAPGVLPHIFERFRQGDSSTTRAHGGLGIGLAITKHIVDAHGGTIDAASDGPGLGATFTVQLPCQGPPPEWSAASSPAPTPPPA